MHLPYILLAAGFLAIANAAAIQPLDDSQVGKSVSETREENTENDQLIAAASENSADEAARPKRGLLLAKAALIGGGILGAKAIGAGLLGAGLYKAKAYGGYGGYGYGGYGYGGYGGYGGYYNHYPQPYYSSGWGYAPRSYYGGHYYSSW